MKLDNTQCKKYLLKHQKFQITSISKFQIFVGAGRVGGRGEEREGGCVPGRGRGGGLFYLGLWAEPWALKFS